MRPTSSRKKRDIDIDQLLNLNGDHMIPADDMEERIVDAWRNDLKFKIGQVEMGLNYARKRARNQVKSYPSDVRDWLYPYALKTELKYATQWILRVKEETESTPK